MPGWTATEDRDLLLSIVAESELKSTKWDDITARMKGFGHDFTLSACRQHFQKLRKEAGKPSGGNSPNPRASASKTKKPAKGASGLGKKRKTMDNDENEDDEETWDAPEKKVVVKKQKQAVVKVEGSQDGLDGSQVGAFKIESLDEDGNVEARQVIDLEQDDMYNDSN